MPRPWVIDPDRRRGPLPSKADALLPLRHRHPASRRRGLATGTDPSILRQPEWAARAWLRSLRLLRRLAVCPLHVGRADWPSAVGATGPEPSSRSRARQAGAPSLRSRGATRRWNRRWRRVGGLGRRRDAPRLPSAVARRRGSRATDRHALDPSRAGGSSATTPGRSLTTRRPGRAGAHTVAEATPCRIGVVSGSPSSVDPAPGSRRSGTRITVDREASERPGGPR